jgi:hypothetical protein
MNAPHYSIMSTRPYAHIPVKIGGVRLLGAPSAAFVQRMWVVRIGGVTYVGVFGVWWFAFGGYECLCLYVELRIPFDVL